MNLAAFYVLISRVRTSDSLRLLISNDYRSGGANTQAPWIPNHVVEAAPEVRVV